MVSGSATSPSINTLSVGSPHTVTATYSGDGSFKPSSGSTPQTVVKDGTTVTVTSGPTPSVFGQSVTFTATVTAALPGSGTPGGTLQFSSGGNAIGGPVSVVNGVATVTDTALAPGSPVITATYLGDTNFLLGAFGTTTQTVNQAGTTTTVVAAPSPSPFGQMVTFTATVIAAPPGAGTPGGQVRFYVDGSAFGNPATLVQGMGAVSTAGLAVGTHQVTATYLGDPDFVTSTATAFTTHVVQQINATNSVTSTATPSVSGQPVRFVATLTGAQGTPTGTVQFLVDNAPYGPSVTLTAGVATSTATSSLSVGQHPVTATYSGNLNYRSDSGGATQTVTADGTTVGLASSANPSAFGQAVHFTATVSPVAPGSGTPTGNVDFVIDGVHSLIPLNGSGVATTPNSTHGVGTYGGDGELLGVTSPSPPAAAPLREPGRGSGADLGRRLVVAETP